MSIIIDAQIHLNIVYSKMSIKVDGYVGLMSHSWVWVRKEFHSWASITVMSYLPQMIVINRFYTWRFNVVAVQV
jgi:hypothetical protein